MGATLSPCSLKILDLTFPATSIVYISLSSLLLDARETPPKNERKEADAHPQRLARSFPHSQYLDIPFVEADTNHGSVYEEVNLTPHHFVHQNQKFMSHSFSSNKVQPSILSSEDIHNRFQFPCDITKVSMVSYASHVRE